ncbi:MAG: cysteine desulfurase [Actinomycetia bacterium]|jgi:cysteine desulfurase/selenocysteine lyase|nr:cysteine desulfurase [Actinomycetes bacterium]
MAVTERRAGSIDVESVRADFPILGRTPHGKKLVYLDSANTSQKPRQVIDTVSEYYREHNANLYRAVYELAEEATAMFETARLKLAAFIGAPDPTTVVFNRGTTESINLVANGWGRRFLKEGDEVLLTDMEHHSNIVPWQLVANATGAVLRYLPLTEEGSLDLTNLESLITERTKVLAVTGQSNVLGTLPPLKELASAAHAVGAVVVVDGAQLVPHNPVDVVDLGIDFLTISGHKMLGPTASGGLYGRRELLDAMDPFLGGGEMIMEVFPDHSTYKEPPHKFEAGTMNIAQEIGLAAAIDYLESLGMDAVREHEKQLTAYAIGRLEDAGAVVHGPKDVEVRGGAVSFWYRDIHPHDLAQVLDQEGVCVRASHHCAQILMRHLGVPATTRASFYVYNTTEDVDALVDALARAEAVFA